ncbi:Eco57I restriction-modification methylase domain-containing protein [Candidatus Puniceispirillum sp.]|nr:Eco57I restriction-modification methylase domain-containing protein [Candidatus Puniceispirillum sp.]
MNSYLQYNPDVLSCLANLSNDEVFTPPSLVHQILDELPKEIWSNPDLKFLDPATKSGVFLREIVKRLNVGLVKEFADENIRLRHIFNNQVFGIPITDLTALISRRTLYCSKYANSKYSVFDDCETDEGNIRQFNHKHNWKGATCEDCGANKDVYERGGDYESYAYDFIHSKNPSKDFNMKFDVIIGNPPYQLETGGSGKQAKPIYQKFVQQAIKMKPRYLSMIIPARWYAGGFGLDEFRSEMLNSNKISKLVDFENSSDVFPGVDIAGGVCYFLLDNQFSGKSEVTTVRKSERQTSHRNLNEFNIFIRNPKAEDIVRKVVRNGGKFLDSFVSPIKPFGLPTNYSPKQSGTPCWFKQSIGLKYAGVSDFTDNYKIKDYWKVLVPKAPIAGQTDFGKAIRLYHSRNCFVVKPGEICVESYIVAGYFNSEVEAKNYRAYLFSKVVRFLIIQATVSQDVNRKNFRFVPKLDDYISYISDEELCEKWGITNSEWRVIDEAILDTE